MKKTWLLLFTAVILFLFSAAQAANYQMSLPVVSHPDFSGELVSKTLADKTAALFFRNLSGAGVPGPTMTYNGVDGEPAVYVFVYYLKDNPFPGESEILGKVSQGWQLYAQGVKENDLEMIKSAQKMITQEGDFLTIVVSARRESGPVVEYFYGLPLHYTAKEKAIGLAQKKLSSDQVDLSQVVFASPFDIWFEFGSDGRKTYVSPLNFSTWSEDEVKVSYQMEPDLLQQEKTKSDWEKIETGVGIPFDKAQYRITGVPDFDWSYGCSPSASADVLGYWDANGYPLLIDYYFTRWDPLEYEWDYNVPNVQQQLSWAMHTDSSAGATSISNIGPGMRTVCNHPDYQNNYGFSDYTDFDQSLGYLINELNLGYPAVWNVISHPTYGNHSMCAMGWGPPDTGYICLHDTWSSTPVEVVVNWNGWSAERYPVGIRPGTATLYNYNNIHANKATMTISNYGSIGDVSGQDYVWNGTNQLFDGSLILSWVVPGDTMIALDMFDTNVKDSWYPFDSLIIRDTTFGQFASAAFIDTVGLGVEVEQYSVGSSNDLYGEFILQQYVIKNLSDTSMQAYASICLDWDLFDAYNNIGGMDQLHNLCWQMDPRTAYKKYRFGIIRTPLDDSSCYGFTAARNPVYIWPQQGWRHDELWSLVSTYGWTNYTSPDTDFCQLLTPRKLTLPPDSALLESFIIFGVDTTQHLMNASWWKPMLSFCGFYRGDVNQDGLLDIADVVYMINYLYKSGPAPLPFPDQGDVNHDKNMDVSDIVFLLNYLFKSGFVPKDYQRFLPPSWQNRFTRSSLFQNSNW
ncbi:MAG: dockerin type I repeat-containing protein [Candidatus Zixiibacteriota bacterium]